MRLLFGASYRMPSSLVKHYLTTICLRNDLHKSFGIRCQGAHLTFQSLLEKWFRVHIIVYVYLRDGIYYMNRPGLYDLDTCIGIVSIFHNHIRHISFLACLKWFFYHSYLATFIKLGSGAREYAPEIQITAILIHKCLSNITLSELNNVFCLRVLLKTSITV